MCSFLFSLLRIPVTFLVKKHREYAGKSWGFNKLFYENLDFSALLLLGRQLYLSIGVNLVQNSFQGKLNLEVGTSDLNKASLYK